MQSAPRVSVIIPTYNRKDLVQTAIQSALDQTYPDMEIIVIDDGSSDGTQDMLVERFGDLIRYVGCKNRGPSSARNAGLALAQGEFIALLDSDDVWLPEKLERQVPVLDADREAVLVFSASIPVKSDGSKINRLNWNQIDQDQLVLEALCQHNVMVSAPCTALIRKQTLKRIGGYDETLSYGEDHDLWLRLCRVGAFVYLTEPMACQRLHAQSLHRGALQETMDRRLDCYERLIEKAFDSWLGAVPDGLKERSLANLYSQAAFLCYSSGLYDLGQRVLEKVIETDPVYWSDRERIATTFINQFLKTVAIEEQKLCITIERVSESLRHLPEIVSFSRARQSWILGQIYAWHAFSAFRKKETSSARYCLFQALRHDPRLLSNVGIWSMGMEIILGPRITGILRSLGRALFLQRDRDHG